MDAYKSEYCSINETEYFNKCSYRGYDYYATMTDIQEKAVVELLCYLCKEHDIPLEFKEDLDSLFNDDASARNFKGIFVHTSVRKDKFDWPCYMLANVIKGVEDKKKPLEEPIIEQIEEPIVEEPIVEETPITTNNTEPKKKSILEIILEIVYKILQKK